MKLNKLLIILSCFSGFGAFAADNYPVMDTTQYSVSVGVSRIIYNLDSNGATFRVNNKQDYPILVRSKVLTEDHQVSKNFVITPPLFRLSPKAENTIQVVRTGEAFPDNKESLAWVCVKGVPPKDDDLWSGDNDMDTSRKKNMNVNIKIAVETCIKMFIRPSSLSGTSTDYADKIEWKSDEGSLVAYNNSPFYINLTNIKLNGHKITPEYIPPMSHKNINSNVNVVKGMDVSWQVINDYGGNSKEFSSKVD